MHLKRLASTPFLILLGLAVVCAVYPTRSTAQRNKTAQPASRPTGPSNTNSHALMRFKTESKLSPGDMYVALDDATRLLGRDSFGGTWKRSRLEAVSYAAMHVEFDTEENCKQFALKMPVISRIDRFADVFVSMEAGAVEELRRIASEPGVVDVQLSGVYAVPNAQLEVSGTAELSEDDEQRSEEIVRGGLDGLTGKGVIIAIIDTGVDFRNDDFKVYVDGVPKSRLLYYWDTTDKNTARVRLDSKPPISYPNGSPVGTLYDQKQLTEELYSKRRVIPTADYVGHGTACASVAAGTGKNDPADRKSTKGVAPEADLIAVRIGGVKTHGSISSELRNGYLLDGILNWLDTIAGDRPLVISCSWGSQVGDPGMSRIVEHRLNARFPLSAGGRAIVFAAGNAAQKPWHAVVNVTENQMPQPISWQTDENRSAYIEIHFDTDSFDDITVTPVTGTTFQEFAVRTSPFTKRVVAYLKVPAGTGSLSVAGPTGREIKADFYINYGHFTGAHTTRDGMIGSPGAADNAISVGSYDFNNWFDRKRRTSCGNSITLGSLSCYSSGGVVRTGYVKPDIVAPGQIFYASHARVFTGRGRDEADERIEQWAIADRKRWDSTEKYIMFDGTSAATPYVAGIIALMMQKHMIVNKDEPDKRLMSLRDVRELLQRHATKDPLNGGIPNTLWGNGKLDLAAVRRILSAIN